MREFAIVKKIEGQSVEVVPLFSNACINCEDTACAKHGKSFTVLNRHNFQLEENTIVKIGISRWSRGIQGISALIFPIACAILAFIFAPEFSDNFSIAFSENFRTIFVLISLLAAEAVVFIVSRSSFHFSLPEITQVL